VIAKEELTNPLPAKLYRGLKVLTCAWPGDRVSEESLLIKVHEAEGSSKLPLIWCGGPPELGTIISICGQNRSIYGLRGTYDFVEPTDDVISKLGKYYADEIEKAIPGDTYVIAGYCAAAYIAMEIAQLLTQRGYKIGFLALVERDVTMSNTLLKYTRKVFNRLDYHGTRLYESLQNIKKYNPGVLGCLKSVPRIIYENFKDEQPGEIDPRENIRYKRRKTRDRWYEFQPYTGSASLFFIRWGVFGFYQLSFFQKYWEKIVHGGITVDFIPGYSHKYPNWTAIIQKMNQRLMEKGY
jgi:hypothetical protein